MPHSQVDAPEDEPEPPELHFRSPNPKSESLQVFRKRLSLRHPLQRRYAKQHYE